MDISIGLFLIFLFILGTIVGSFLNVVILRHNTGKSLAGRSGCMVCGRSLRFFELIPILSFIVQRGKCNECKSKISLQYPLVEVGTAILFTLSGFFVYNHFGTYDLLLSGIVLIILFMTMSVLVIMTTYDFKHTILPDKYTYSFACLALISSIITSYTPADFLMSLLGGVATALPIFALWFFSKGRAMGFGDVKLSVGIGIFLGIYMGISALWFAFIIGAIYGLVLMLLRKANAKSEVAFGPFLILGFLVVFFTGVGFIEILNAIIFI